MNDIARHHGYSDPVKGTDTWTMKWDAELTSFDYTSDTITFILYT